MNATNRAQDALDLINHRAVALTAADLSIEQEKPDVRGGVLAIAMFSRKSPDEEAYFASRSVGFIGNKCGGCAKNATEKIYRLRKRRMEKHPDIASSQSANPEDLDERLRTYGGCIVFETEEYEIYISFSGAPAKVDEAIVFVIGENYGLSVPHSYILQNDLIPRTRKLYADNRRATT
ncbi:MAG: hypothetical protein A3B11_01085 [Candidatus Taylorbacteria bacterium RIFCSPLOWO2_01_FULL_44_26]|uniref:Uncharacterized protein n=2 Tax=Candidatus Tayloriibacteriota TaxID=1817919 RepID=A0A1G2MJ02_9BACT|nr:MAG: hypothetical protein A3D50_00865 [Candidatus Taylorbacteria bacterium RIFCSPHIGHO2_02_FULL_44_12]OHA30695.1 MAG: hypothetical protein A3B11_01085 [Candidatus Taylorbacteria bacterium RIFCSPLOWO2_01_FULL_44_26]